MRKCKQCNQINKRRHIWKKKWGRETDKRNLAAKHELPLWSHHSAGLTNWNVVCYSSHSESLQPLLHLLLPSPSQSIMDSPFPAISLIIFLLFSSSKPSLSTTVGGVDTISRLLQIQHRESSPPSVQEAAARGVLLRLLPSHSSSFHFRIVSKAFQFLFFFLLSFFFWFFFD